MCIKRIKSKISNVLHRFLFEAFSASQDSLERGSPAEAPEKRKSVACAVRSHGNARRWSMLATLFERKNGRVFVTDVCSYSALFQGAVPWATVHACPSSTLATRSHCDVSPRYAQRNCTVLKWRAPNRESRVPLA